MSINYKCIMIINGNLMIRWALKVLKIFSEVKYRANDMPKTGTQSSLNKWTIKAEYHNI